MKKTRRKFIKTTTLTAASLSVPNLVKATVFTPVAKVTTHSSNGQHILNREYSIVDDNGIKQSAILSDVEAMKFHSSVHIRPSKLPSSAQVLRFTVDNPDSFSNKVYTLKNTEAGKVDLLLSVVPDSHGKLGLEAILN